MESLTVPAHRRKTKGITFSLHRFPFALDVGEWPAFGKPSSKFVVLVDLGRKSSETK